MKGPARPTFYEFFAGGGMVRAGLGHHWTCLFANDIDGKKGLAYRMNWGGGGELVVEDIRGLGAGRLPDRADLMWGSFPCQDLSLAGSGAGLAGPRSGTFHPFWDLVTMLNRQGRAPGIVAIENVCGTLTSHGGSDFALICTGFAKAGYRFGALVIDAALFLPQSRPRLFVIGARADIRIGAGLVCDGPRLPFHTAALVRAVAGLDEPARGRFVWWDLPPPAARANHLADLVEDDPKGVAWHAPAQTARLLAMMSPANLAKVSAAQRAGRRTVGAIYRRTRRGPGGERLQRVEVRFDGLAGCLRTPGGGSSRQFILVVDGETVRSRLISARETASLMGLDGAYRLPKTYSDAYHLTGDGVAVPVVRHLAQQLFEPLLGVRTERSAAA